MGRTDSTASIAILRKGAFTIIELALLNAIIATRDFSILTRHGVNNVESFKDYPCAYKFISDHLREYGEVPSIESVITSKCTCRKCAEFEFVDVTESPDTLALKLIERNLKLDEKALLTSLAQDFGVLDGYKILERLRTAVDEMTTKSLQRAKGGVNWTTSGAERIAEYEHRKHRDYGVKLPLLFDEINSATGGAEIGDVISLMASTGIGKSWMGLLAALIVNRAGYRTLFESAEMSKIQCSFRTDTLDGGFSNRGLWTGRLDESAEDAYKRYLDGFKPGTSRADMIIKTPEDWAHGLTLEQLEYDIRRHQSQFVVIDQFNLMRFKSSKHEDKALMSRQLKQLAARLGVVIFLLYQTNGDYVKDASKTKGDGIRELMLPTLGDYSETIAIIQDSAIVLGFDAVTWKDDSTGRQRGKALLGVLKGRNGGAGTEIELQWCPDDGVMTPRQASDVF